VTRAGGHYATQHTHIDDFVENTRLVTPAGVMQTRRLPGSGAGPAPDRLVLGSEGTLGVITEAWVRCRSAPLSAPRPRCGLTTTLQGVQPACAPWRSRA
jgi:alkyldihydroxyacetonephosphate synthase